MTRPTHVPQLDHPASAGRGQDLPVGAERGGVQRTVAGRIQRSTGRHRVPGRGHVPQPQRPVRAGGREEPAIRAEADRLDQARGVQQPGGGRGAGRLQQARRRLGGAGGVVGGHAELGGQGRVLAADLAGLDGDLAGVGVVAGAGGRLALLEREPGQGAHGDDEHGQRGDEALQGAGTTAFGVLVLPLRRDRRGDELAGQRARRGVMVLGGGPVPRGGELATAPQGSAFPPGILPGAGGLGDPPAGQQAFAAGVDPGP